MSNNVWFGSIYYLHKIEEKIKRILAFGESLGRKKKAVGAF